MKRATNKFEPPGRLTSIDAYRGFVMLLMASEGLRIAEVAHSFPNSPVWQFLASQVDHVEWVGCSLWDLIQPSFTFLAGWRWRSPTPPARPAVRRGGRCCVMP
jgi:predicted acyltransferase